jgi:hypothetical protein
MAERQCAELLASRSNEWIIADHEATCSQSDKGCEHKYQSRGRCSRAGCEGAGLACGPPPEGLSSWARLERDSLG